MSEAVSIISVVELIPILSAMPPAGALRHRREELGKVQGIAAGICRTTWCRRMGGIFRFSPQTCTR